MEELSRRAREAGQWVRRRCCCAEEEEDGEEKGYDGDEEEEEEVKLEEVNFRKSSASLPPAEVKHQML